MSRLINFSYNLDRAVASFFGAPSQETISSEIARVAQGTAVGHNWLEERLALLLARLLGPEHLIQARAHANALDTVEAELESEGSEPK